MTTEFERGVLESAEWMEDRGMPGPAMEIRLNLLGPERAKALFKPIPPASPGAGVDPPTTVAEVERALIDIVIEIHTDRDAKPLPHQLAELCEDIICARALASSAQKDGAGS